MMASGRKVKGVIYRLPVVRMAGSFSKTEAVHRKNMCVRLAKRKVFYICSVAFATDILKGRFSGLLDPMTWDQEVSAVVWYEGSNVLTRLMEFYPTDPYFSTTVASSLSCISADGEYVMGYAADQDSNETSFYVSLNLTSCVEQGNTEINVFPNPAAAQINVVAENEINTISVINMMGQVVFTQEVNAIQTSINAQELPAGVYFLDIVSGNSHSVKRVSVVK